MRNCYDKQYHTNKYVFLTTTLNDSKTGQPYDIIISFKKLENLRYKYGITVFIKHNNLFRMHGKINKND